MASLKEVKMRIASVESTRKITQARQMISSSHLHRTQALLTSAAAYSHALESLLATLHTSNNELLEFSLSAQRKKGAVALVAVASNSSMCGAFNARMAKEMLEVAQQYAGQELLIFPIGKKLRKPLTDAGYTPQGDYDKLSGKAGYEEAARLVEELVKRFAAGELQKVLLLHYHYRNMATQHIVNLQLLPYIPAATSEKNTSLSVDGYILEPSHSELHSDLALQALKAKFYAALMDTHTSEHGARTMAMQLASENADEMLDELHLSYNKLRQQNITSELLDIIGGQFA
ncbi:MAG: ATP synthase F1 subunit gamma [Prevotellaceae bacterium]|jgi:F-type H+-transporting ATPase subunit gamma|nr:ATP synthase F1 subunit gamma [Prevotellaceae bacterium]